MTRIAILLLLVSATSTNAVPVDGNNNLASGIAGKQLLASGELKKQTRKRLAKKL